MTVTTSTGAVWVDVSVAGIGLLFGLSIFAAAILTHPGTDLGSVMSSFLLLFLAISVLLIAVGVWYGKRTHWRIPDPGRAKRR